MSGIRSVKALQGMIGPPLRRGDMQALNRYALNSIVDSRDKRGIQKWAGDINRAHCNGNPNFELVRCQTVVDPAGLALWLNSIRTGNSEETICPSWETDHLKVVSVKLELLQQMAFMRSYTRQFEQASTMACIVNANLYPEMTLVDENVVLKENMYVLGTLGLSRAEKTTTGLIYIKKY